MVLYRFHKFKARPVKENGKHFASKLEWQYNNQLELEKSAGLVLFFLRQVPFHLPGGVKYLVDFVVFYVDGTVKFIDVKGMMTKDFIAKKKMVEDLYPITIEIIKYKDFKRA
jgi:hypothetical protein